MLKLGGKNSDSVHYYTMTLAQRQNVSTIPSCPLYMTPLVHFLTEISPVPIFSNTTQPGFKDLRHPMTSTLYDSTS